MTDHPIGELCGSAKKQGDGTCARPAGWGTDHVGFGNCKLHGGASPNGIKHAESEEASWRERLAAEIDPSIDKIVQLRDAAKAEPIQLASAKDLLDRAGVREAEDSDLVVNIRFSMNDIDK